MDQPHQPPTQPCPECGSQRVWKDGIRHTRSGNVQRYICRECGHRFSDGSDPPEHVERVHTNKSYRPSGYILDRRVSVALAEGTKNLAEVESRIQKRAAGATKPTPEEVKGKIIEYMWHLKKQGYAESTVKAWTWFLKRLVKKGTNLMDPESVKLTIARHDNWSNYYKAGMVQAYNRFAEFQGIRWDPPNYRPVRELPFIPLEREIDQLIAGCGRKVASSLQLMKETGMRIGEAWQLKWTDVDEERQTVKCRPEKHGNPRMIKVSSKCMAMLKALPKTSERVFGGTNLDGHRGNFIKQRRRLARKLQNPRLLQITFHTLRHWKGTMEYHRTKDILHVKQLLGHRNINSTLVYTQLVNWERADDFTVRVTREPEEIKELLEVGFEYVCEKEGLMFFRKRK